MIGLALGGWLNDVSNWRTAFFAIGLPGAVLALAMALIMREPRRGAMDGPATAGAADERPPTLLGTFKLLWSRRSFRHLALGVGLYAFGASAMVAFSPAFMMRSHGMTSTQVGATLGVAVGISGIIGTLAGGTLGDLLGRFDKRWYLWLPGICLGLAVPCILAAYLAPNVWVSLAFIGPAHGLGLLFIAPSFAMTQALATPRTRAMASAVLFACMFLIGNSFGPTVIGAVSDALAGSFGKQSLRYAMCLVVLTNVWGVFHYLRGAKYLRADLEQAQA
jgi:predicted MFS family arabinose efflux permease